MGESLLEYYRRKKISTEHGVDDEWDKHLARRKKLYRQLGIPVLAFKNSSILEIGPGSGHNTRPLLTEWNVKHIDLLEPSETARQELEEKFSRNHLSKDQYTIYGDALEEYQTTKTYDMIIAEGFLHCAENWKECLVKIEKWLHKDSIIILTCTDEISCYVEKMKRAVMQYLTKDIEGHDSKVSFIKSIIEPQLSLLKGMSRTAEDWIEDQIFYPVGSELMTIGKVLAFYGDSFDVLGASQNIFVDYSWYKDFEYDYISSYRRQYEEKKHMFLLAGDDNEVLRTAEENGKLEEAVVYANDIARELENGGDIGDFIYAVRKVSENTVNPLIIEFNKELIEIMEKIRDDEVIEWNQYKNYMQCFGKSMQYISFVKK